MLQAVDEERSGQAGWGSLQLAGRVQAKLLFAFQAAQQTEHAGQGAGQWLGGGEFLELLFESGGRLALNQNLQGFFLDFFDLPGEGQLGMSFFQFAQHLAHLI